MTKPFLEVFPDLHIADEMRELLRLVGVEKVTTNRDRSSVRIYMESPRLIHKKNIYDMEKGIRDQLFPGKQISIKIMEKYKLSGQYTPEKLFQVYKDSLLLELKNYSIVEYNILRKAECRFPEPDLLAMTVEDTMINREKAGELKRVMEKVFHERCGLPLEIHFTYVEAKESVLLKKKEQQIQREVEEITLRSAVGSQLAVNPGGSGAGQEDSFWDRAMDMAADPAVLPETPDQSLGEMTSPTADKKSGTTLPMEGRRGKASAGKGTGFGKKDGQKDGFKKTYRRSDNPDVLYGRDFEGDAVEIDKIDGEIGEVILRGKVIRKEKRELRSGKTLIIFDLTDFTDTMTVKMFAREETLEDIDHAVKEGAFIRLKGVTTIDKFDGELTLGSV